MVRVASETASRAISRGRWQAPARQSATMTTATFLSFMPELTRRARMLEIDRSPAAQEEVRSTIALRLVELAGARSTDATGAVVHLADQHPSYIVQYAAGRAYSELRRARREAARAVPIVDEPGAAGVSDIRDDRPDADPASVVEGRELTQRIAARLPLRDRTVYRLLIEGHDRGAIGARLGLDRRRVHESVLRIRSTAAQVLADDDPVPAPLSLVAYRAHRAASQPARRTA